MPTRGSSSPPSPAGRPPRANPRARDVCRLAPLSPGDEATLREFFASHSMETVLARYGFMVGEMTRERARELVGVNQESDVALGLFHGARKRELRAVGRYYSEPGTTSAEIAVVVHEQSRRCGLATRLLRELAAIARNRGLSTFHAQVRSDNAAMRQLLERYRPAVEPMPGNDSVRYRLSLENVPAPR